MSAGLFKDEFGRPLCTLYPAFYLDSKSPESLIRLIEAYGGEISSQPAPKAIHLVPLLPESRLPKPSPEFLYSDLLIYDSVRLHRLQPLHLYRLKVQTRRNSYSDEDKSRLREYAKANDTPRKNSPQYWKNAKEVLRIEHSPESMRKHYGEFLGKEDKGSRNSSPKEYFEGKSYFNSTTSSEISALKRAKSDWKATKIVKYTENTVPLPTIIEENQSNEGFEALFSPSSLIITRFPGRREVKITSQKRLSEREVLEKLGNLAVLVRRLSGSDLSLREVVRTLVHWKGDVKAVVKFYGSREG